MTSYLSLKFNRSQESVIKIRVRDSRTPCIYSVLVIGLRAISINCRHIICGRRNSPNPLPRFRPRSFTGILYHLVGRAQRNRLIPDYPNRKMALALVLSHRGPICARLDNESWRWGWYKRNCYTIRRGKRSNKSAFLDEEFVKIVFL